VHERETLPVSLCGSIKDEGVREYVDLREEVLAARRQLYSAKVHGIAIFWTEKLSSMRWEQAPYVWAGETDIQKLSRKTWNERTISET
jgi:hypothetical protein